MSEPRPNKLTPEIALIAARTVAAALAKGGMIEEDETEASAEDIAKYGRQHMDGYELAKELDNRCYWDCNLMMAEELDSFSNEVRRAIDAAEKAWAERNAIAPPLAISTPVTLKSGETGVIDGIYKYGPAKFSVAIDGDKEASGPMKSRRIVNFEDVTARSETPAER